jgi:hypothetical protein
MTGGDESLKRVDELLAQLEVARAKLEADPDPDEAIEVLTELSEIAKAVEAALEEARREAAP